MNLIHHASDIAISTGAGALAGHLWGPLGQTGGAIYGLTSGVAYKVIHLACLSAMLRNQGSENSGTRQAIGVSSFALGILATVGSLHLAAMHTGAKLTFKGGLVSALGTGLFMIIAVYIRNALLPGSQAIVNRDEVIMRS